MISDDAGRETTFGLLMLIGTGVIWGTIGVVSKWISDQSALDAISITWLRAVIATPICLGIGYAALGTRLFSAGRRDQVAMAILGAVLILYQWLYLAAIARIGVSAATLVSLCGAPVLVAVLSTCVLRETMTRCIALSLVVAVTGTALLIGQPETGLGRETLIGIAAAVGCALGISCHVLGLRSIAGRVHPLQPMSTGFPVGAVLFAPVALHHGVDFHLGGGVGLALLYLGVFPSTIAYFLYQGGLRHVPATMASIVTMLEPLVAAILAWVLFDERLRLWGWLGGALLLTGIALLAVRRNPAARQYDTSG